MNLKRTLYLGYYLKQLDRSLFDRFLNYTIEKTGRTKASVMSDITRCVYRYNISILEYFQFRFYELPDKQRREWAGTGYMYEYQLKMNPIKAREILDDKRLFYKKYNEFFVHRAADSEDLKDVDIAKQLIGNGSGKIVFKASDGKCGAQVEIREGLDFTSATILPFMKENEYDLVEEFIDQHPEINRMSPSAVNTIRIFTQLNEQDEAEILGCRFRISVNSPVDNMAAGNLAAPVDECTGVVSGPGVYSDITKEDCELHPVTGVKILGFQIPFWSETIQMVKKAALKHPENRSIGWDVVITKQGPGLIEGNHDWCKLLWQLPVKKGLKHMLESYLHSEPSTVKQKFDPAI